ncbi:hypothetical protein [Clostridium butyricum]|uniref:hypothetical protein n=1 Tax=Clostridium butyricum TaxID=1492 RepID=UPI00189FFE93|nr:hypothetical protein [Clostridium butyricum]MDB2151182.1 hypothetical protein [Clostridium butyricum]
MRKITSYICSNCGKICLDNKKDKFIHLRNCECGKEIESEELYPTFNALNFISISKTLYDNCKDADRENNKNLISAIQKENMNISQNELTKYILLYEKVLQGFEENNVRIFNEIEDEFEKAMIKQYKCDYDTIDFIIASFQVFYKNRFRKPFVIMVSSSIEMLFNDFFETIIELIVGESGAKIFKEKYRYASVNECVDICSAFLGHSLKDEMNSISTGFYDEWNELRKNRNSIVHSNNKYITKKRADDIKNLIDKSIYVFSNLKSNFYKGKYDEKAND